MLPVNTLPGQAVPASGERPEPRGPAVQLLCVRRPGVPGAGARGVRARARREAQGDALAAGARGPGFDRGARGARMEATPGDAVDGPALRDARDPRRPGARGALRIGERPDLSDVDVRAGRGRPAEALGLRPGREPDARGLPGGARRARRGHARVRVRERDGGGDHAAAHVAARRSRDPGERRLRRDVPAARERPVGLGPGVVHRRPGRRGGAPGGDPSHDQARVGRDAVEPDAEDRRSRRGRDHRA